MKCAVVELKYVAKKFFIVRTDYIKNFKGKYSSFESVLCYISTDLSDEPNFVAKYSQTYDGETGVYKVFIRKITEAAIAYLKESKRVTSVPKKYRVPQNTDSELNKEEKKQKLIEKRMQKLSKDNASRQNASHLADLVKSKHLSPEIENSDSDSAEKVTNEENRTSLLDTFNNETQNTVQDDSSPPLTAEKPQKSTAISSQIKVNTSNTSKVFPEPCSTKTEKKGNNLPLPVSAATKPFPPNVVRNKNENYQLNVFERNRKYQKSTATKPIQTNVECNAACNAANKMLSSSLSTCNNEVKQQNGLIPKQKGHNPELLRAKVSKSIHTKAVVLDAASSSSVINKNQKNQPIVLNTKQKDLSSSLVTTGATNKNSCQSSSVINKNPQTQKKKSQNELSATKTFRTETVTSDTALKSSTTSSTALLKRKTNSSENIAAKKQKFVALGPNDVGLGEQCTIIKALKEENAHLKIINKTLTEEIEALLKALVVCTKSLPKPLSFEEKDGGRQYNCGIFLDESRCKILDSINDDRQFCNYLAVAVFGFDALKRCSVTGAVSNRTKGKAKPPLDPNILKFIYDIMAIRTNNSILFTPYKINKIINKKIANLLAGDQPKQPRKSKKGATNNDCEEDYKSAEDFEEDDGDENTQIDENGKEDDDYNYNDNDESADEQFEENNEATTNEDENTQIDANGGDGNGGDGNAGDGNAGVGNAGDGNAGDGNAGDGNAGDGNAGNGNKGNIRMVNEADGSYFLVDMPDLQYDFMYDYTEDYSLNDL